MTVPAGGIARFAARAADHPAGADIDVYAYRESGSTWTPAGTSNDTGSDEEVVVDQPGRYRVFHHLYSAPAPATVVSLSWVAATSSDALTASPPTSEATAGTAVTLTLTWRGLEPDGDYFGVMLLEDGTTTIRRTLLEIA
ncbi:hypothetical protein AB0M20_39035 [Actinoplanes sp. NPDC051633]|uniref:hypothetical protein n=1 Tax=Actinoplanes sp. NPDC051633 TaxID=3155670 RepID=UPI0034168A09